MSQEDIVGNSKEDLLSVVDSNKFDRIVIELKTTLEESDNYSQEDKVNFFKEIKLIEKEHAKLLNEIQKKGNNN